jgi:hypothetical protein
MWKTVGRDVEQVGNGGGFGAVRGNLNKLQWGEPWKGGDREGKDG